MKFLQEIFHLFEALKRRLGSIPMDLASRYLSNIYERKLAIFKFSNAEKKLYQELKSELVRYFLTSDRKEIEEERKVVYEWSYELIWTEEQPQKCFEKKGDNKLPLPIRKRDFNTMHQYFHANGFLDSNNAIAKSLFNGSEK